MIDKTHIQKFYSCQKYVPSNKEVQNLKDNIYGLLPLVNFLIDNYKASTPNEVKAALHHFINTIFNEFSKTSYIDSRLYELQAINSILKNPSIIQKEYENIKYKPNTHSVYTADLKRSQKLALVNALDEVRNTESFAKEFDLTSSTNLNNVVINSNNEQEIKEIKNLLKSSIQILKQNDIQNKIMTMLKIQKQASEDFIKGQQISSLSSLYTIFSSFGLLHSYLDIYDINRERFGFADLKYELTTGSYSVDSIGINELFSEQFLKTLSIEDLCLLNVFWCIDLLKNVLVLT